MTSNERPGQAGQGQARPSGKDQRVVLFLRALAASAPDALPAWLATDGLDQADAGWLYAQGLAPFAFHRLRELGLLESLAADGREALRQAYYHSAADAAIHDDELCRALAALSAAGIVPTLFKGAVLAHTVYPSSACRPMGDLDLWLADAEMQSAQTALKHLGYVQYFKAARPVALQAQRRGEIQLVGRTSGSGLIELHWGVFAGEWLERAAAVDETAIRDRRTPIDLLGHPAWTLAPEDAVIQLVAHLAINHQFAYPWLRGLLDIVLVARWRDVDWDTVAARASEWRLGTVVWQTLRFATDLFGLDGAMGVLERLRPGPLRRWLLRRLVNAHTLLEMRNLTHGPLRLVLQLLLVDRPGDAMYLFRRALWPEDSWLAARYGRCDAATRTRHLLCALRGRV